MPEIVIERMPLPYIVDLCADVDERTDALVGIISDSAKFAAGDISFLEFLESTLCFASVIEEERHARRSQLDA